MRNFLSMVFGGSMLACKRHKALMFFVIALIIVCIILGVFAGIKINHSLFPQDFSNVVYIKFLKGSLGFSGFLFSQIFTLIFFVAIILVCSINIWLIPIGLLFLLYFVYSQTVTIISISMEFGFFNTLILLVILIAVTFCYFILFCLIFILCVDNCGAPKYFSVCMRDILPILLSCLTIVLLNTILLLMMRKFVFILVYKS